MKKKIMVGILYSHFYSFFTWCKSKYYLQVYLDNCAYKIIIKRMIDYLDGNIFETDEN